MTTTTTSPHTSALIADGLKKWPHTYDGIPVIEIGDDGEWLVTVGHVDKNKFARACDDYYRDVRNESLTDVYEVSLQEVARETTHKKARIVRLEEFPFGDFELRFDNNGDVDVTVWMVDV